MTVQVKKFVLLSRKPGMAPEDFRMYWRERHGPLVASSPGYGDWRQRYVQNHVLGSAPFGGSFMYEGIAEFWIPGSSPNEDDFAQTDVFRDIVRPDELKFLDLKGTVSLASLEQVLIGGKGELKVMVLSGRPSSMSDPDFRRSYQRLHASTMAVHEFARRVRGWAVNYTIEGTERTLGETRGELGPIDCIEELWFDDLSGLEAAAAALAGVPGTLGDSSLFAGRSSFVAAEYVMFDRNGTMQADV